MSETPGAQAQAARAAARKRAPRKAAAKAAVSQSEPTAAQEATDLIRAASESMGLRTRQPEPIKPMCDMPGCGTTATCWRCLPEPANTEGYADMMDQVTQDNSAMTFYDLPASVDELWSDVMESVRSIEKGDYNEDQGFKFRGVDSVVDAVGPALRRARIKVIPKQILEHHAEYYETRRGTRMVNRTVRVQWEVRGPRGDSFVGESMGEAADAGDKSMSKAQSVAYRVFLLEALNVPTGQPDPDSESHERAAGPQRGSQPQESASDEAQAMAGEENQAAAIDNAEARKELWRTAKGLGWEWAKLAQRFRTDYGMGSDQAQPEVIEAFTMIILAEAEAEEDKAKQTVREVLGGKPVEDKFPESRGDAPIL